VKPLNPEQLVELVAPDDAVLNSALRKFEVAAPVLCREPGYCAELVSEGWMEPAQINWNGAPAFVITWHVTTDNGFWLDIAQSLGAGAPFDVLVHAVEQFARSKRCRYIRFLTLRRGLVPLAHQHGYKPEAVLLTKTL